MIRLPSSALGKRLFRGTFWSVLGVTCSRGSLLVSMIVAARLLGRTAFGELGVIQSTVGMLQSFGVLGMGQTATKYVAENRLKNPGRASGVIALSNRIGLAGGLAMAALLVLLAPRVARSVLAAPHLTGALRIAAGMLLFGALLAVVTGALAGLEAFKRMARMNLVVAVLSSLFILIGVWRWGVTGAVCGLVAAAAAAWLLMRRALAAETRAAGLPPRGDFGDSKLAMLWGFGVPAVLGGVIVAPVNWIAAALLVREPNGYAEMGIYSAVNHWRMAILHVPLVLGQVLTPMFAERAGASDASSVRRLLRIGMKTTLAVSLPVVAVLALLSPTIVRFYGAGFENAAPALVVMLATALLTSLQYPLANAIVGMGRMWAIFWMNLGWGIVTVALTYWALPWGALGLAMAQCGGYLLFLIANVVLAQWMLSRLAHESTSGVAER
ncbi:MAG: oligosaccharide flippase family protein [bacterium]